MYEFGDSAAVLGYGAANLGNLHRALTDQESWEILDTAWNEGVRYFDTAPHYGLGLSERRLGEFLRTKPREEYVLSTKVGRLLRPDVDGVMLSDRKNDFVVESTLRRTWDFSPSGIEQSVVESLERLGVDRVDVLLLHDPERHDFAAAMSQSIPAMARLRDSGMVSAVGVGSMDAEALEQVATHADIDVLMVAGRYTLLEQPAAGAIEAAFAREVAVIIASVFNSGLLASARPQREGRYEYGEVPEPLWRRVLHLAEVCARHGVDLPEAAVQFAFNVGNAGAVVIGASRPAQITQSVQWSRAAVPRDLWLELRSFDLIPDTFNPIGAPEK